MKSTTRRDKKCKELLEERGVEQELSDSPKTNQIQSRSELGDTIILFRRV